MAAKKNSIDQKPKCSRISWCPSMGKQLQPATSQKVKGLSAFCTDTIDAKGKIHRRLWGVVSRVSSADRGILLNCCPWCRAKIFWDRRPNIISID